MQIHNDTPQSIPPDAEIIDLTELSIASSNGSTRGTHNDTRQSIPPDAEIIDLTGLSIASSDGSTRGSDRDMSEDASVPWYQDLNGTHPFSLTVKGRSTSSPAATFTDVEFFPWAETTLEQLWNSEIYITKDDTRSWWSYLVAKWRDTAAMCGGKVVRLISTLPQRHGHPIFQVALPVDCRFTVTRVKWALNPWDLHPLLLYTHSSVLHIFDVEARRFLGCIRGHGGDITSIGVHHLHPHLVFTTSRDCTIRIYDLRITDVARKEHESFQEQKPGNPFGLQIDNDGGECLLGKCIVVLTGGRSGGHEAAVLGADFHASLPLIATCGMDHALRIWHLGPALFLKDRYLAQGPTFYKEDKPLFSSTMIHDARVISIHWLSHETLMSHSAPPIARMNGKPVEGDSGTLIVWQWLSVNRFFPPGSSVYQEPPLRGCISDYRESCEPSI
ncbi:hypothetical protein JB92DRAFT_3142584 [Gautieria morchelliformis]|nr:hypothetical protein JB92DRAFT_3142584 [Gautieria morchelliformis]